jgi:hypothetical protein
LELICKWKVLSLILMPLLTFQNCGSTLMF